MEARAIYMTRGGKARTFFKTKLSRAGWYLAYPICDAHLARVKEVLGPSARLNSAHKILHDPDKDYGTRALTSRLARFMVYERCGGRCAVCGAMLEFSETKTWQVDHIVPVFKGGKTAFRNLQTLCLKCHDEKSSGEKSEAARTRYQAKRQSRWLTHPQKDALLITQRDEITALRNEVEKLTREREHLAQWVTILSPYRGSVVVGDAR